MYCFILLGYRLKLSKKL